MTEVRGPTRPFLVPGALVGLALLLATFPMPFGYYDFLRLLVAAGCIWLWTLLATHDQLGWLGLIIPALILWNPVLPITLSRLEWLIPDLVGAGAFGVLAFREHVTRPRPAAESMPTASVAPPASESQPSPARPPRGPQAPQQVALQRPSSSLPDPSSTVRAQPRPTDPMTLGLTTFSLAIGVVLVFGYMYWAPGRLAPLIVGLGLSVIGIVLGTVAAIRAAERPVILTVAITGAALCLVGATYMVLAPASL